MLTTDNLGSIYQFEQLLVSLSTPYLKAQILGCLSVVDQKQMYISFSLREIQIGGIRQDSRLTQHTSLMAWQASELGKSGTVA